jgi:hypothetical protein
MRSKFAGKKLRIKVKTNPRQKGSHGERHFRLYKNGMRYETLAAKKQFGYRHLRWDVQHGFIEFR